MPGRVNLRPEVVDVRLSPGELAVIDDLVAVGLFSSRSDIVHWLVTESLKATTVERLCAKARKTRTERRADDSDKAQECQPKV